MFDLPVAQALFSHLCTAAAAASQQAAAAAASSSSSAPPSQPDSQQLAKTFSALKRERASRVTEEQRQQMYMQLMAQMDALPPIFVRTADCHIQPLVAA